MDRYLSPPPTSSVAVCVWIPLFALRCEEARRPELAYVGTDGLEGLYGGPEQIVEAIKRGMRDAERGAFDPASSSSSAFRVPRSAFRVGWGKGKFVAWVAATRAKPGGALIVPPGEEGKFLAAQPVAVLPLDPDAHRRLRPLGLRTLGQLAAPPAEASR